MSARLRLGPFVLTRPALCVSQGFRRLRGEPQILLLCVTISASGAGVVGARAFVPKKNNARRLGPDKMEGGRGPPFSTAGAEKPQKSRPATDNLSSQAPRPLFLNGRFGRVRPDDPTTAAQESGAMGDEGKAAGCVSLAVLL